MLGARTFLRSGVTPTESAHLMLHEADLEVRAPLSRG
jgi:hypothetical protein